MTVKTIGTHFVKLEIEREDDGRWLAEVTNNKPGIMAYGDSPAEAVESALDRHPCDICSGRKE